MGRKSKIEAHPQSEEIIRRLASGEEYSKIVEDFPDIRYQDLDYYAQNNPNFDEEEIIIWKK